MPGRKLPEEQRREEILRAAYRVAARDRLTALTAHAVAAEAGVSKGLIFFHFGSREAVVLALLSWLLRTTVVGPGDPARLEGDTARERLISAIRGDIEYLPRRRERVELFFDYWVLGTRNRRIQRTIRAALDGYRDRYIPLLQAMVDEDPQRFAEVGALALATNVAAFVEGCALRAVLDPASFDADRFVAAVEALILPCEPAAV